MGQSMSLAWKREKVVQVLELSEQGRTDELIQALANDPTLVLACAGGAWLTPLHAAARGGNVECVEAVCAALDAVCASKGNAGARRKLRARALDARTAAGATPAMLACREDSPKALALLLTLGCDPSLADSRGRTALHHCAYFDSPRCAALLLADDRIVRQRPDGSVVCVPADPSTSTDSAGHVFLDPDLSEVASSSASSREGSAHGSGRATPDPATSAGASAGPLSSASSTVSVNGQTFAGAAPPSAEPSSPGSGAREEAAPSAELPSSTRPESPDDDHPPLGSVSSGLSPATASMFSLPSLPSRRRRRVADGRLAGTLLRDLRTQTPYGTARYMDARTSAGMTPLHEAVARGSRGVVAELLKANANLRALTGSQHRLRWGPRSTPLHLAAHAGDVPIARAILRALLSERQALPEAERGPDPRAVRDAEGRRPVDSARSVSPRASRAMIRLVHPRTPINEVLAPPRDDGDAALDVGPPPLAVLAAEAQRRRLLEDLERNGKVRRGPALVGDAAAPPPEQDPPEGVGGPREADAPRAPADAGAALSAANLAAAAAGHPARHRSRNAVSKASISSIASSLGEDACPICFDAAATLCVRRCGHAFCQSCLAHVVRASKIAQPAPCPLCRRPIDAVARVGIKAALGGSAAPAAAVAASSAQPDVAAAAKLAGLQPAGSRAEAVGGGRAPSLTGLALRTLSRAASGARLPGLRRASFDRGEPEPEPEDASGAHARVRGSSWDADPAVLPDSVLVDTAPLSRPGSRQATARAGPGCPAAAAGGDPGAPTAPSGPVPTALLA